MNTKKIFFLLILLQQFSIIVKAQKVNITGDTIFVNTDDECQIKFPSDNIEWRWTSLNPAYSTSKAPNSIFLHAKDENAKCSNLSVFEGPGPRSHSFVVCYKKNIDKVVYDYSTKQKLQQRAKEIDDRDAAKKVAVSDPSSNTIKGQQNQKAAPGGAPTDSKGGSYYAILEEGDRALKNGLLDDAQDKYEQVIRLQPDNDYPKKRLADVKEKKAEKERLVKKEQDDKVNLIKSKANKAFSAKQYDDAMKDYQEALALQPNDIFSKSQIILIQRYKTEDEERQKKENERLAKKEQDDKINALKTKASKAFDEKRYDDATAGYNELLSLNTSDAVAKSRLEAIQKIKEQNELKEKQERQNKDRDETFNTIVGNADKAFADRDFDVAKAGYLAAKDIKPADASIDKKIKLTNDRLLSKQNEEEYNSAISAGDEAKKAQDYKKASAEYTKAARIFKDRTYASQQLNEIDKIVNKANEQQKEEKEKLAKDLENNNKYTVAIESADKALEKNDYLTAKNTYTQASKIKPEETYPKEKLSEIAVIFEKIEKEKKDKAESDAQIAALNKKYNLALEKGKAALDKKDYNTAKAAYTTASELKPAEQDPKSKLDIIEKKLTSAGMNAQYDSAMARGNIALGDKNYTLALENYKEAQRVKPVEALALNQIKYIQSLIVNDSLQQIELQHKAEVKVKEEIRLKRFNEGMAEYSKYEKAAQVADFEEELLHLKNFLNIIPDDSQLNTYQYNQKIEESRKKIEDIRRYLSTKKGIAYQAEAIPYLDQDLEKKYESLNFSAPPEEQVYAATDSANYNENIRFSKELLTTNGRLNVLDSMDNIKVSCPAIGFKGDKAFYKLGIQNRDAEEFLTGTMLITLIKKDGTSIKNYASYISSFPIIQPGKEFFIIYVTKDQEIRDDEKTSFDLTDRFKKKKLHISISGSLYNQEKKLRS